MEDDSGGSTGLHLSNWTSSETIEAFAEWLSDYGGQETVEIKLDNAIVMQVPIRRDLVDRFVEHVTLVNSRAAENVGLRRILEKALHVDRDPQGDVLNVGQDEAMPRATGDFMADAGMRGCKWCAEGSTFHQSVTSIAGYHADVYWMRK
ncbi:hypothetical protein FRB95_014295 [Tulasnella sp. JGI-2019a]|nr:hypothetical protein FRB95_014295 [Tulasnella sp. JGI-2019a]